MPKLHKLTSATKGSHRQGCYGNDLLRMTGNQRECTDLERSRSIEMPSSALVSRQYWQTNFLWYFKNQEVFHQSFCNSAKIDRNEYNKYLRLGSSGLRLLCFHSNHRRTLPKSTTMLTCKSLCHQQCNCYIQYVTRSAKKKQQNNAVKQCFLGEITVIPLCLFVFLVENYQISKLSCLIVLYFLPFCIVTTILLYQSIQPPRNGLLP